MIEMACHEASPCGEICRIGLEIHSSRSVINIIAGPQ